MTRLLVFVSIFCSTVVAVSGAETRILWQFETGG